MRTARLLARYLVSAALLGTCPVALAGGPDGDAAVSDDARADKKALKKARKRAKRYEKKAKKAYAKGRWDDAIVAFELAHQAQPKPSYLFNIGRCHEQKGDLFRAMGYVQAYVDTVEDEGEREDAAETYAILRGKLLKTRGELSLASEPSGAVVLLEGGEGKRRQGTTPFLAWLEAGPWSVRVSLDGYEDAADRVVVAVGASAERRFELERPKPKPKPKPSEPVAKAPTARPEAVEQPAPASEGGSGLAGWLALASGGALLAGGAAFGVLSSQAAADVARYHDEPGSAWRSEAADAIDAANDRALAANVLLGAGALAASAGLVLLLLGDEPGETSVVPAPGGLAVRFEGLR